MEEVKVIAKLRTNDDVLTFEGKADFTLFFEWFRSRQEYENSVKIEDGTFVDKNK